MPVGILHSNGLACCFNPTYCNIAPDQQPLLPVWWRAAKALQTSPFSGHDLYDWMDTWLLDDLRIAPVYDTHSLLEGI